MNRSDRRHNLRQLRKQLAITDATYPLLPGLAYRSPYGFVAEHGREYRIEPWSRFPYPQGLQRHCFGNAINLAAVFGLKYVEGVAVAPSLQVILHGWAADEQGRVIDSTWMNTGLLYLGVEFSVERGDDATWNGDAHVLNDENRNYPVFQKRWEGEDYSLTWPYSDRLEALRLGLKEIPQSVRDFEAHRA